MTTPTPPSWPATWPHPESPDLQLLPGPFHRSDITEAGELLAQAGYDQVDILQLAQTATIARRSMTSTARSLIFLCNVTGAPDDHPE